MKKALLFKAIPMAFAVGALLGLPHPASASSADSTKRAFAGIVACGGNHFDRVGGTEGQRARYTLRNLSADQSIFIDRIRMFDAQGGILFDSTASGLPTFFNGVLGPGDNSLDPHQSAHLRSEDVLSGPLSSTQRPIQTVIDWSANAKVLLLEASLVRISRRLDVTTGKLREERGRHQYDCRHIRIVRRPPHPGG